MPLHELRDPTVSGNSAQQIRRARGFALADGDTAAQAVVLVDATTGNPYDSTGGGSSVPIGGPFTALPTPTTDGAALAAGVSGVELTLPPGASVTYTIASSAPTSAPTLVRTIANPGTAVSYLSDQINLATGELVYVTAASGGAFYRTL